MSAERNSEQELEVDVDVTGDTLQIQRETVESVKIDRLFQPVRGDDCDARLILWSDSAGWNGFERRDGEFYRVNVLVDTVIEGKTVETESEYVADEHVDPEDVADAIRTHIRDEKAGGAGRFARGCSPP